MKLKTAALVLAVSVAAGGLAYKSTVPENNAFEGSDLPFEWHNANVYFVITDRFANGERNNDNSYGRPYKDDSGYTAGTFHGGDFAGLTSKLDYIRSLGVNAIWVSSPVEQIHGWVGGGPMGIYQYYAYHGYYPLDFTSIDANLGTVDEFRNFVTEAHKRGIRVMIDVVMNHSGYATLKDMCDFKFGRTTDNVDPCAKFIPDMEAGQSYHNKPIDASPDDSWNRWWGKDWIRFDGYGQTCGADDSVDGCLAYLPDFKNSDPNGKEVTIPVFLQEKWSKKDKLHDIPAAIPYRQGQMSVAQFEAHWLASWVEEFGIDGFRCDTVKYVPQETWKLLKELSENALNKWRLANKGKDPAASWSDPFYMTGEVWGFTNDPEDKMGYGSKGGFDSLIDFYFNPDGVNLNTCIIPDTEEWNRYAQLYGRENSKVKLGNLTYISSHDTSLCRKKDMEKTAVMFTLMPGAIQMFYGDETSRENDKGGGIDLEQGMRSDMNFPADIINADKWAANVGRLSTEYSSNKVLSVWQKVGQFRLRNPAVGAGAQYSIGENSFCRIYQDKAKGIDNRVVIHLGESDKLDVSKCFANGTVLQDGYSGNEYRVINGSVEIKSDKVALLEVKRL
ncbi:alpha-amylase [Succinivibrio dextrinosolvens]|uniref:alpha-amylase family glycosyl hydrolase n=1 Tax=Succinivibrio dextrinosolvens TaxID=83771 RepID=UPI0008E3BED1|nr:alpha-amylase family glycosyl hydrolase [Succinivibrio dextrinosolvens]SFS86669.1 alpha-amylase [Succinivibrio dextrinosolvens]